MCIYIYIDRYVYSCMSIISLRADLGAAPPGASEQRQWPKSRKPTLYSIVIVIVIVITIVMVIVIVIVKVINIVIAIVIVIVIVI